MLLSLYNTRRVLVMAPCRSIAEGRKRRVKTILPKEAMRAGRTLDILSIVSILTTLTMLAFVTTVARLRFSPSGPHPSIRLARANPDELQMKGTRIAQTELHTNLGQILFDLAAGKSVFVVQRYKRDTVALLPYDEYVRLLELAGEALPTMEDTPSSEEQK